MISAIKSVWKVAFLLAASLMPVSSQTGDPACCAVVRIEAPRQLVTAREIATGFTFRIEVKNRKHLAALRIGDKVWADFAAKKATLEAAGETISCRILDGLPQPLSQLELQHEA